MGNKFQECCYCVDERLTNNYGHCRYCKRSMTNGEPDRFRDARVVDPTEKYEIKMVPVMIDERLMPRICKSDCNTLDIKNVIFNEPATIVFWTDGTKTVVKCAEDDEFDPEKGIAMAISKKIFGNQGSYYNKIKKWTKDYEEKEENCITVDSKSFIKYLEKKRDEVKETCNKIIEANERLRIVLKEIDNG